jgi:uncharacterized membrane-anchored protein
MILTTLIDSVTTRYTRAPLHSAMFLSTILFGILLSPSIGFSQVDMEGLDARQQAMVRKAQSLKIIEGPSTVKIGSLGEFKVPEGYSYLDSADAQTLLSLYGNPEDPSVLGLVRPNNDKENWFMIFSFDNLGYVKDANKEKIDANALLKTFRDSIPAGNAERARLGSPQINMINWSDTPFYDTETNNLTWGLSIGFSDGDTINYEIRMLGRSGVMSASLVATPEEIDLAVKSSKELLKGYSFVEGARYADWKPGDKIAQVGLIGLIGGGSLALAAKTGLLAKLGLIFAKSAKAIIVVGIVVIAFVVSMVKRLFGSKSPT